VSVAKTRRRPGWGREEGAEERAGTGALSRGRRQGMREGMEMVASSASFRRATAAGEKSAPVEVRSFIPLSSGGLCEAVTITPIVIGSVGGEAQGRDTRWLCREESREDREAKAGGSWSAGRRRPETVNRGRGGRGCSIAVQCGGRVGWKAGSDEVPRVKDVRRLC
jgi:hypothetical protein